MNKKFGSQPGDRAVLWGLVIMFCFGLFGYNMAFGSDSWGYSFDGVYYPFAFESSDGIEMDSGYAYFGYPSSSNEYDTLSLLPDDLDSTALRSDSLHLDSIGEHDWKVRYWLSGTTTEDSSTGTWYHGAAWSLQGALSGIPTYSKTCAVSIAVLDNSGDPVENVRVTAQLVNGNVRDSAGFAVVNTMQSETTNILGIVTFNCRWSSYLIPATDWRFTVAGGRSTRCTYTVPRETTVTLNLDTDCD